MEGHNILAVIPARANSKRLPGKNLKTLDCRPLIAYSVLVAKSVDLIDDVVVASDSREIDEIGINMRCWNSVWLPEDLTDEHCTLSGTLEYTTRIQYIKPDWVCLFQPTCPLRTPNLVRHWIQLVLNDPECDGLLTVDRDSYKLGTVFKATGDGYYVPLYEPMTPKQNIKPTYRENGVFYMFRAENVLKGKPFDRTSKMIPVVSPKTQSLANIDTQEDWNLAEWLYWSRGYGEMFQELEESIGFF